MSDTTIFWGLVMFFILTGLISNFINSEFSDTSTDYNMDEYGREIAEETTASMTLGTSILSILKMATWSFGDLPLLVELLIFMPIRILFYYIGARLLRGV